MKLKRWHAFMVWLVGTLVAIAVLGENMYFGVGIAVAVGLVFGLVNWWAFRQDG